MKGHEHGFAAIINTSREGRWKFPYGNCKMMYFLFELAGMTTWKEDLHISPLCSLQELDSSSTGNQSETWEHSITRPNIASKSQASS